MCKKLFFLLLVLGVVAGTPLVGSAQIITSVVRTPADTGNPHPAIAEPFEEECLAFMDRTHEYEVLPPELPDIVGAEYIKTSNSDKTVSLTHDVTISQVAAFYLILDNRLGGTVGGLGTDPVLPAQMAWVTTMGFVDRLRYRY
jgi:hypothetical protein